MPARNLKRTASTNRRLSAAVPPTWPSRPGRISLIRSTGRLAMHNVASVSPPQADRSRVTHLLIRESLRIRNTKRSVSDSNPFSLQLKTGPDNHLNAVGVDAGKPRRTHVAAHRIESMPENCSAEHNGASRREYDK